MTSSRPAEHASLYGVKHMMGRHARNFWKARVEGDGSTCVRACIGMMVVNGTAAGEV